MTKDGKRIGKRERLAGGMATGSPGTSIWFGDDRPSEASEPAPATGSLATSGQDDVERADTVSGLGSRGRRRPPARGGKESGEITPGNRLDNP